ncbi:MAG: hypothetical protein K2K93_01625, partial [Muribaculaceae bacterium]|nr:hypothetical protein [Muribaculaceae bacterium]
IEAADNGEMLELAVLEFEEEKTLYHSYFKPLRISRWPITQEKHHITPDMVRQSPPFKSERARVQGIVDDADAILGLPLITISSILPIMAYGYMNQNVLWK